MKNTPLAKDLWLKLAAILIAVALLYLRFEETKSTPSWLLLGLLVLLGALVGLVVLRAERNDD